MTKELEKAITNGDFVWSDMGNRARNGNSELLTEISLEDAFAVGYVDITEQGSRNLAIALAKSRKNLEKWRKEGP